jgi:hypothetical protein
MNIYKVTFGITNVIYVMAGTFAEAEKKTLTIMKRDYGSPMWIGSIEILYQ